MNHLATTASPYLLEHASHPVAWYPWGEEAFRRAREERKPIFLSIGYSTCHWCHVMADESFENEAIAALLNAHFIAIKVDREERPDVDRLYMRYVQLLTGRGGWPLSVWLTPELKPFFGGTYFPPTNTTNQIGFPSVLIQLIQLWEEHPEEIEIQVLRSMQALEYSMKREESSPSFKKEFILENALEIFSKHFDEDYGGFTLAPKFPRPSLLFFLLRYAHQRHDFSAEKARSMVLLTLEKMAVGGIHDQLGGGFHRYSVDRTWTIPHFEKMLYDQAQLAMAYLEAYELTEEKKYAQVVHSTLHYVLEMMRAAEGGFYSAQDADSEDVDGQKREGAYYLWFAEEIKELLSNQEYRAATSYYHLQEKGNIDPSYDPHGEMAGKNILFMKEEKKLTQVDEKHLHAASRKLYQARAKRQPPHRDEKILVAWNALMITALARAGITLKSQCYLDAAIEAAFFIHKNLYDQSSKELYRSYYKGSRTVKAFAEDYAFLIQGLLDLYEATFDLFWLQWAEELQQTMNELFWDGKHGGYFNSSEDDPYLFLRLKEEDDGAEPSANSIAALNLLRFSHLFEDISAAERATKIFHQFTSILEKAPLAVPQLLLALWYSLRVPRQLVIVGKSSWSSTQVLLSEVRKGFHPDQSIILLQGDAREQWLEKRNHVLEKMKLEGEKAVLYRCDHYCCEKIEA